MNKYRNMGYKLDWYLDFKDKRRKTYRIMPLLLKATYPNEESYLEMKNEKTRVSAFLYCANYLKLNKKRRQE